MVCSTAKASATLDSRIISLCCVSAYVRTSAIKTQRVYCMQTCIVRIINDVKCLRVLRVKFEMQMLPRDARNTFTVYSTI